MQEITVRSRIIQRLAYDGQARNLQIEFKNKEKRLFGGVPSDVVDEMVSSASPGQFYIDHIRKNFRLLAA